MIKIFAKHGTDEKVLASCQRKQVRDVQLNLAEKYGGSWVLVDEIEPMNEILHFNDGLKYQGSHGRDERYCNAIDNIR